jgi:GNAT superfamily N-acetyltransferase
MAVTIADATTRDVPALVDLHTAAFRSDLFSKFMLLDKPDNAHQLLMARSIHHWLEVSSAHIIKAVDNDGKIVGWACWVLKEAERNQPDDMEGVPSSPPATTPSIQQPAPSDSASNLGGLMHREAVRWATTCLHGRKHIVLQALATHPDHQGHGIGSRLVRWITDRADTDRLPCWAHASPAGHGLYTRAGFQELGHTEFNLDEWAPGSGKESGVFWGLYRFRYMLRIGNCGGI